MLGVTALVCMMCAGLAAVFTPAAVQAARQAAPSAAPAAQPPTSRPAADAPQAYEQVIPETTVSFDMMPVPGDGGEIKPFLMSATEVTWDMYDLFAFAEDSAEAGSPKGSDALTRPSKPYLPPDRGFGHAGYPVLSTAMPAAQRFCDWLSQKTGHTYRLPTQQEWAHACALNSAGASTVDDIAWHAGNAQDKTHPVASKKPGAIGLYDMLGNAGEWVVTADGKPAAMGGSYKSELDQLGCEAIQKQERSWQMSDPQLPKSKWWLSDCSWVSFRVVREMG